MSPTLQIALLLVLAAVPQRLAGSSNTTGDENELPATTTAQSRVWSSEIEAAIEKFRAATRENRTSVDEDARAKSARSDDEQAPAEREAKRRKLIRSRYRLRSRKDGPPLVGQQQQQQDGLSNYSQPFVDPDQARGMNNPSPLSGHGELFPATDQSHYLAAGQQGRSLGPAPPVPGAPSDGGQAPAPATSYGYQLAGPPQESAAAAAVEPDSYSQVSVATSSQQHLHLPAGRMYAAPPPPPARMATKMPPASYYLAAPSSSLPAYSDHYGAALASSVVPSATDYAPPSVDHQPHAHARNEYYGPYPARNYSDADQFGPAGSHLASSFDYLDGGGAPMLYGDGGGGGARGRGRWSWPWTDVSNFGFGGGGGGSPMNTAATFKKHKHHHHHYHPMEQHHHHKEHHHEDHHEEHALMPKWEHGITVGEIVCVAVAVVLGIIILGSPFFLLFLMLFNGGNLFGATQMGLLAPAAVQGVAAPAAGRRRRRRRSIDQGASATTAATGEPAGKLRTSDLLRAGEYLFERLSPLMDADTLLRSFERMMDVKDDIEKIITKIGAGGQGKGKGVGLGGASTTEKSTHQHTEMRRKKK